MVPLSPSHYKSNAGRVPSDAFACEDSASVLGSPADDVACRRAEQYSGSSNIGNKSFIVLILMQIIGYVVQLISLLPVLIN